MKANGERRKIKGDGGKGGGTRIEYLILKVSISDQVKKERKKLLMQTRAAKKNAILPNIPENFP